MIASDIFAAFSMLLAQCDPVREAEKLSRINEMASGMGYFITDLTSRRFFNTLVSRGR